jgi:hypothetical protein
VIHHAAERQSPSGCCLTDPPRANHLTPHFADSAMADLVRPCMELSVSETMKEVVSSTARILQSGELSSFDEVAAHLTSEVSRQQEHFGNFDGRISRAFSAMCRNAAAMYAGRKANWLLHALQESANRVVSRSWAEGAESSSVCLPKLVGETGSGGVALAGDGKIESPPTTVHSLESGTPNLPQSGTHRPAAIRRAGRQRKISHEMLPSRCKLCPRIFEGKYRDDHLRRHVRTVHSTIYLTCELCGRRLKNRTDNFGKHLRAAHPDHVFLGLKSRSVATR